MENYNANQPQQPYQPQPQYQQGYPAPKPTLPNAVASLVLGILSIVTSCWFVGLILGIIGLVLGNKGRQAYMLAPDSYSGYGMLNAGRIMSIIGICIGGLYILYVIVFVAIVGMGAGLAGMSGLFQHMH
ncbi:MAG: hypothetical protein LIO68_08490 [Rikenellaceae bacterium]|nr:hypothetical protein [Rikenellaceae bacterium]